MCNFTESIFRLTHFFLMFPFDPPSLENIRKTTPIPESAALLKKRLWHRYRYRISDVFRGES